MASRARWLAVGGSLALHAAVAAALVVWAREPIRRALLSPGAVEVGVVFTEPKRSAAPAPASTVREAGSVERVVRPSPGASLARPKASNVQPAPGASPPVAEPEPSSHVAAGGIPTDSAAEAPVGTGVAAEGPGTGVGGAGPESAGAAGGSGVGSGTGGGGGAPDVDQELRSRLAKSAARCYPRAAQRFRAEGTTRVRFCVGDDGRPRNEEIVESSGQSLLDDAAVRCVIAKAAPFPRTASCFTVPVHFFVP
ncbi:MAG: TonB family protein [Myxococcales bacterium]